MQAACNHFSICVQKETHMEEELWPSEDSDGESEEELRSEHQTASLPIQQFFVFTLLWQFVFKISNTAVACLF